MGHPCGLSPATAPREWNHVRLKPIVGADVIISRCFLSWGPSLRSLTWYRSYQVASYEKRSKRGIQGDCGRTVPSALSPGNPSILHRRHQGFSLSRAALIKLDVGSPMGVGLSPSTLSWSTLTPTQTLHPDPNPNPTP